MNDFTKMQAALTQCATATNLSAKQMENAMIYIDRMASSFGKGQKEFRTWTFVNGVEVWDDVTTEQFSKFVLHKSEMLAAHSYVLQK
jgi:hypothetical protein